MTDRVGSIDLLEQASERGEAEAPPVVLVRLGDEADGDYERRDEVEERVRAIETPRQ